MAKWEHKAQHAKVGNVPLLQGLHDFCHPRRLVRCKTTDVIKKYHANRRMLPCKLEVENGVCHRPSDEKLVRLGCCEINAVSRDAYSVIFDADAVRRRAVGSVDELFEAITGHEEYVPESTL